MKRILSSLLLAGMLLLSAGCAPSPQQPGLQLYYISTQSHGPSLIGQPYGGPSDPTPLQLLEALLAGPTQEELRSPFPENLSVLGCTLEEGVLRVDFSEQYGGLTDIALTLADYCVVLTVCQLDGIDSVEITVSGHSLPYRSHQRLTRQEALPAAYGPSF